MISYTISVGRNGDVRHVLILVVVDNDLVLKVRVILSLSVTIVLILIVVDNGLVHYKRN